MGRLPEWNGLAIAVLVVIVAVMGWCAVEAVLWLFSFVHFGSGK